MIIEMYGNNCASVLVPDECEDDIQVYDPKTNDGLFYQIRNH